MSTYNYQDSLSSVKFLETTVLPQILSCHKKKKIDMKNKTLICILPIKFYKKKIKIVPKSLSYKDSSKTWMLPSGKSRRTSMAESVSKKK